MLCGTPAVAMAFKTSARTQTDISNRSSWLSQDRAPGKSLCDRRSSAPTSKHEDTTPIDSFTEIPTDLFDRLLVEGVRTKMRGQHCFEEDPITRRRHLVRNARSASPQKARPVSEPAETAPVQPRPSIGTESRPSFCVGTVASASVALDSRQRLSDARGSRPLVGLSRPANDWCWAPPKMPTQQPLRKGELSDRWALRTTGRCSGLSSSWNNDYAWRGARK